jgi:hypothetical protein
MRQGDPLSLLLFCIVEEVLSRVIALAYDMGTLFPMNYCRGVQVPKHVLNADDVMIFSKATKSNIRCLLNIFQLCGEVFGQMINQVKS